MCAAFYLRPFGSGWLHTAVLPALRRPRCSDAVKDDLEKGTGSGVPFGVVEAGEVADQEDDVAGIDVRPDDACSSSGAEQGVHGVADRSVALVGEVTPHRMLNSCENTALELGVLGQAVEPGGEGFKRWTLGDQQMGGLDELFDVALVDLGQQGFAGREVAVERALSDARSVGDRVEPKLAGGGQRLLGRRQDPGAVAFGICAAWSGHDGADSTLLATGHLSIKLDRVVDMRPVLDEGEP